MREQRVQVVLTNGCFDLLHRGHVEYLNHARVCGDALIVAINSDSSVAAVKGPDRPVVGERDRAYLLASLACVDVVHVFATRQALQLITELRPDLYVKGGDYTVDTIDQQERKLLDELGCTIRILPLVPGMSTTGIISRLRSD